MKNKGTADHNKRPSKSPTGVINRSKWSKELGPTKASEIKEETAESEESYAGEVWTFCIGFKIIVS